MTTPLIDTEAQRLRSLVPDNPVRLPPDHLACEACGIAVAVSLPPEPLPRVPVPGDLVYPKLEQFARCPSCQYVHSVADAYVEAHPALAARIGPQIARERVESVLFGLAILGQQTSTDLGLLLLRLQPAAHAVRFANPLTLTRVCAVHIRGHT